MGYESVCHINLDKSIALACAGEVLFKYSAYQKERSKDKLYNKWYFSKFREHRAHFLLKLAMRHLPIFE